MSETIALKLCYDVKHRNLFCNGKFECCFYLTRFGSICVYMGYQHFRLKSYDLQRMEIRCTKSFMNQQK